MSWKVHETDEVFAGLRGMCSNSYRMYDPCEHRSYYDHDCDTYECAVEDAAMEYQRLLDHCNNQREQLRAWGNVPTLRRMADMDEKGITDELREWYKDRLFMGNGWAEIDAIADRIDAEHERGMADAELGASPTEAQLSELGYAKLPVDADGVPIRVGDEVAEGDDEFEVRALTLYDRDSWDVLDRLGVSFSPLNLHHVKPDSWERIIEDAEKAMREYSMPNIVMKLVERCRRLAGGAE